MDGAFVAYHNTQKIFGFEYITLKEMEQRIFGCQEFSDQIFTASLCLIEQIFDRILEDFGQDPNRIFKIGFYANEKRGLLDLFIEVFDNEEAYNQYKAVSLTEDQDIIDHYLNSGIKPKVIRY